MSLSERLKKYLERTYYVPFDVKLLAQEQEPQIIVEPARSNQSLFDILLQYQNHIRLSMELKPHLFSANMVRSMGNASSDQKEAFVSFCKLMTDDGAKIFFSINNEKMNPLDWKLWPADWQSVSLRVTIIPIVFKDEDKPDYEATSIKWGGLMTGCVLSLLDIVRENKTDKDNDLNQIEGFREGNCVRVLTNRYERNPTNRIICLKKNGYSCSVCGFNFEKRYGELGRHFIHVHHIVPVSQMGSDYVVNPLKDLVPVCPNCHAMLHTSNPPLTPAELKRHIKE